LIDGLALTDFDPNSWRERTSAGFQDFARFHLLARESVGVGYLPRLDDEVAVADALDRASASDLTADLPTGLSTQLGRTFEGGVDLSGGQWQKVALGRSMMREAPLLLMLDEPTSSLDAKTEHALFERYAAAARGPAKAAGDGRGVGGITILVSHRFSTVRMADLIVVLDGSRVAQVGTHEDLMAKGGPYAELYGIQAAAYR
jgi:ATP-binding cassette subfamily B protein